MSGWGSYPSRCGASQKFYCDNSPVSLIFACDLTCAQFDKLELSHLLVIGKFQQSSSQVVKLGGKCETFGDQHSETFRNSVMEPSFDLLRPPRTFPHARVYQKVLLALGFLALATNGVEGADTASKSCDSSGWDVPALVDGILALFLAAMWGLRSYLLIQSYAYNRAPYWASLRNSAFWLSVVSIVVASVAILLGWCIPTWHATMQNVVAVVVGAVAVATAERRAQGPASARLKALQRMLRRPYYRDGRTGGNGYSDDLGRRLFEERDNIARIGKHFKEGGWDCTLVETSNICKYYVEPGPTNDHFFMGRYQVLEAAGSSQDPLAFAAAYAAVTAPYMFRPKLKRVMVRIASNIVEDSGRVKSSLASWRPEALAQLLGMDEPKLPDLSQLDDWPKLLQDTKSIVVLWALCWLEDALKMEDIMKGIARHLAEMHASGTPWEPDVVADVMVNTARKTWIGSHTAMRVRGA